MNRYLLFGIMTTAFSGILYSKSPTQGDVLQKFDELLVHYNTKQSNKELRYKVVSELVAAYNHLKSLPDEKLAQYNITITNIQAEKERLATELAVSKDESKVKPKSAEKKVDAKKNAKEFELNALALNLRITLFNHWYTIYQKTTKDALRNRIDTQLVDLAAAIKEYDAKAYNNMILAEKVGPKTITTAYTKLHADADKVLRTFEDMTSMSW